MGLFDRAVGILSGDGGAGPRCPHCRKALRLDDPSEGRYVCENPNCTWEFFFDEGDGALIDPAERTGREYARRKLAGEFDEPVTYRVTFIPLDGGGVRETHDFSDVDQGYSYYEQMKKSARVYSVTWNHVPG